MTTLIGLITGASGGIGRALAQRLHDQGIHVVAVGRDASKLQGVAAHTRVVADPARMCNAACVLGGRQTCGMAHRIGPLVV